MRFLDAQHVQRIHVSIHAPARGAIFYRFVWYSESGFNSRTREGCDIRLFSLYSPSLVSIHAPARGAIGLSKRLVIKGLRRA